MKNSPSTLAYEIDKPPEHNSRMTFITVVMAALPALVAFVLFLQQTYKCCKSGQLFVDDPFISMRFAANVVHFGELSFNHGVRVEGYSNLLHVLIHALTFRLRGSIPDATTGIDEAALIVFVVSLLELTILCGLARSRNADSRDSTAWYYAWVLTMAIWPFAFWATAGLETPIEGLLYLVIALVTRNAALPGRLRLSLTALVLFCVTLIRFEGILISLCLAAAIAAHWRIRLRRPREAWGLLIITVLTGAAYHLWRWIYFANLLPNTYIAKATGGSVFVRLSSGAHYCGNWFAIIGAGIVLVLSLSELVNRFGPSLAQNEPTHLVSSLTPMLALVLVVTKVLLVTIGGGDWMPGFRMLVPVTPFALYLAVRFLLQRASSQAPLRLRLLSSILFAIAIPFVARGGPLPNKDNEANAVGKIRKIPTSYVEMGRLIQRTFHNDEQVAIGEAGLIPFEARDVRFMDLFGLVDADMARQEGGMHRRVHTPHVIARHPAAVVFAHLKMQPPFGPYQYGPELLQSETFHVAYRRVKLSEELDLQGWALYARRDFALESRDLEWLREDAFALRFTSR